MTMIKKQITEIKNRDSLTEKINDLIAVIFINRSNQV